MAQSKNRRFLLYLGAGFLFLILFIEQSHWLGQEILALYLLVGYTLLWLVNSRKGYLLLGSLFSVVLPAGYLFAQPSVETSALAFRFLLVAAYWAAVYLAMRKLYLRNIDRAQKEFSQVLLHQAKEGWLICNNKGIIVSVNSCAEQLFGYPRYALLGENIQKLTVPSLLEKQFGDALKQNTTLGSFELQGVHKSGNKIPLEVGLSAYHYAGKAFVLVSLQDLRERKQQQEVIQANLKYIRLLNAQLERRIAKRTLALRKALKSLKQNNELLQHNIREKTLAEERLLRLQQLYSAMAHHYPDGIICVLNSHWEFVLIDGQALHDFGYSSAQLVGKKVNGSPFPLDGENTESWFKEVFHGRHVRFETTAGNLHFLINAVPLPDATEQINEIFIVFQNISERKRMEKELRDALSKEKELGELKSRFVSTASHEFRTPLSTILSSAFLMEYQLKTQPNAELAKHLNRIMQATRNMNNMLGEFLSSEKIASGKTELHCQPVRIEAFIHELILEVEAIKKPEQTIEYAHEGSQEVVSDPQVLRHIVYNLLSNALKYSPPSSKVKVNTRIAQGNFTLEVSDQGIGIPEEESRHIFKPFFRAKNAAHTEGTGLGLHIVHDYVKQLGGSIGFESKLEQGSRFIVKLPAGKAVAPLAGQRKKKSYESAHPGH